MNTTFDPEVFLAQQHTGSLDTRVPPLPEAEYPALIDNVELREVNFRDGGKGLALNVMCLVEGPEVKEACGVPSKRVRYNFLLDLAPDGSLDMSNSKNLRLGRLREAIGQNTERPWSFLDLKGQPVKVRVKHTPDKNDPEVVYDEVASVTALA